LRQVTDTPLLEFVVPKISLYKSLALIMDSLFLPHGISDDIEKLMSTL